MAQWFEDLTKTMADEKMGRRAAIQRVAGTVAGVAVAGVLPGTVQAKKNRQCLSSCTCPGECVNCLNNPNTNCFCFTKLGGKAFCGCNSFCSQVPACSSSMKCPKGTSCAVETACNCSSSAGVCIPNCKGKHKNCKHPDGHGLTVTGRVV